MMRNISKSLLLLALAAMLLVGCATLTITNVTPTNVPRSATGQYMVEMQVDTTQQTLLPDTITNTIVVGFETFPMRRTKRTQNRWEGYITVPASKDVITYHFKCDYLYQGFGKTYTGSAVSQEYKMLIH